MQAVTTSKSMRGGEVGLAAVCYTAFFCAVTYSRSAALMRLW